MKTKIKFSILLLICFFALTINSCKKKKVDAPKMYTNYFGLTEGRYVIYDVQEMFHDVAVSPQHDTNFYQLKTLIGAETTDNQGRNVREFKRYKRNKTTDQWVISDLWTAVIENNKAELVEENQRIIKLVFAPTSDKKWNPNAFNIMDSLNYYYSNIHKPYSLPNISFDSTVTVSKDKFFSLIDYKIDSYKYATNIGLVSKTYKNLTIANFDTLDVRKGSETHYKCIGYGFE